MTYEQIETFLTVVTCGNITAAANELFVTQSTVSSRIQSLENELGAPLLIRAKGHHSVELTVYHPKSESCSGYQRIDHRKHRFCQQLHAGSTVQSAH